MNAREEVLARIAAAHRAAAPPNLRYEDITRDYRTTSDASAEALTELLIDRLVDYRALVRQCSTDDLAATIAAALAERGARTVVVSADLDSSWTANLSASVLTDGPSTGDQLSVAELDEVDGVITSCAAAIAETGTLVLDGSAGRVVGSSRSSRTTTSAWCFADQIVLMSRRRWPDWNRLGR